jgi:hypothetical protein
MTLPTKAFLCVVFHQKKVLPERLSDDIPGDEIIFNYASFSISNGHVRRFRDRYELSDYINELQETDGLKRKKTALVDIYCSNGLSDSLLSLIKDLCTTFFVQSDQYSHYIENTSRLLAKNAIPRSQIVDLPSITNVISNWFSAETGFVAVRDPVTIDLTSATTCDFDFQFFRDPAAICLESKIMGDIIASLRSGNDYSGRLVVHSNTYYYKILPVAIPARLSDLSATRPSSVMESQEKKYYPIGTLIIASTRQIDRICYVTAKELLKEISGPTRIAEQLREVNDLHAEILQTRESITRTPLQSHSEVLELFRSYANKVVDSVVNRTSAHSATIRAYDPFRRTLGLVASRFGSALSDESRASYDIAVTGASSLNAFVFSGDHSRFHYIPNVREPKVGRPGILVTRAETESEVCFRLIKGGVPFGTMNVEAPYAYSLGKDLVYCQELARLLGEFFDVVTRTSDAAWLPKMSLSHLVHHRIEKIRRERPEFEGVLDFIEVPMRTARVENGSMTLNGILNSVVESFDWLDSQMLKALVSVPKTYELQFRKEAAASIAIIVDACRELPDPFRYKSRQDPD